jgi:hypothetical protein
MVGFGAWSIRGGFEIDRHALAWHGSTATEASVSAIVLGLLELAVLAPAAWLCALLLLGSAGIGNSETVQPQTRRAPPASHARPMGPNGAGKSTTMRMILGLDAPRLNLTSTRPT